MQKTCFAALGLCLLSGAALADDCKQLAIVTSVDLETTNEHNAVFAPVTLEGKAYLLQVDTGDNISVLTEGVVNKLGLDHEPVNVALVGVNGTYSNTAGRVKSFTLGNLHASNVDFMISKNFDGEDDQKKDDSDTVAGLLGADVLGNYDVEFDFGGNKLTLLSPDHCRGKVIYWPAAAVAAVPITVTRGGDISFPVTLDGKAVNATLDTGASTSVVNLSFAENNFGLTPTSPGVTSAGTMNKTHGSAVLSTHFKTLTFGDDTTGSLTVANPGADLVANFMGNSDVQGSSHTGTKLPSKQQTMKLPDMLLGMNVLRHLHVYIAYGEGMLYITPASTPAAKP